MGRTLRDDKAINQGCPGGEATFFEAAVLNKFPVDATFTGMTDLFKKNAV